MTVHATYLPTYTSTTNGYTVLASESRRLASFYVSKHKTDLAPLEEKKLKLEEAATNSIATQGRRCPSVDTCMWDSGCWNVMMA